MIRPNLLTESEIENELKELPLWIRKENTIVREIVANDFISAVAIFNSIAIIAESMDHHPDILLYGWNKLRITLSTHDRGGLTELDFKLAKKIEELYFIKKRNYEL
ncbi:MAG: 4a-hydroxytetrahydrobiopterin dehydratase [Candidatus Kapaibacteriota bacterium]